MTLFYQSVRWGYRLLFSSLYGATFHGKEALPQGGAIIAANHTSYYDPPLIGVGLDEEPLYLTYYTFYRKPLFGTLLHHLHSLPVGTPKDDMSTYRHVAEALREGRKIVIFPEGHRTRDGRVHPLKQGVARLSLQTGCPIIPTWIEGAYAIWNAERRLPKLRGKLSCTFGEAIYPKEAAGFTEKEKRKDLLRQVVDAWEILGGL